MIFIIELKEKGITNKNILSAIKKVPRELFVNKISAQWAYENMALPVECEQTISQPYVVAYMIDCLKLKKTDKVLRSWNRNRISNSNNFSFMPKNLYN